METTLLFECLEHGPHQDEMGCCPKCAAQVSGEVRTIQSMMASSLEALAERLK